LPPERSIQAELRPGEFRLTGMPQDRNTVRRHAVMAPSWRLQRNVSPRAAHSKRRVIRERRVMGREAEPAGLSSHPYPTTHGLCYRMSSGLCSEKEFTGGTPLRGGTPVPPPLCHLSQARRL